MFEVAIESWLEEGIILGKEKFREEVRAEEREEGHKEVARNALAEGATFDFVQKISGLDMETLKNLQTK